MGESPFPLDPQEPDLVLEPVIGWRVWRLRRDPDGVLVLESPLQALRWRPREPARARCHLTSTRGRSPHDGCTCGLYAASSAEHLRAAGVPFAGTGGSVIGTVAMWGRVIEHRMGCRGELAYPDRIRLVCTRCFATRRRSEPKRVFLGPIGELTATCASHAPAGTPLEISPGELQSELLSTYAVDLLPFEALGQPLPLPSLPAPARTVASQARREARALVGSGVGRLGILILVATFFLLRSIHVLTSPVIPDPPPASSTSAAILPLPGTGDPPRYAPAEPAPEERRSPPILAFLCGHRHDVVVTRVPCGSGRVELVGGAWFPPESPGECGMDGYTRKGRYSVCWLRLPAEPREPPPHPAAWRLPGVRAEELFRSWLRTRDRPAEGE